MVRRIKGDRSFDHIDVIGGNVATREGAQALIDAGPRLLHVGTLLLFIFICFGILGVQLFRGALRERCHVYRESGHLALMHALEAVPCGGSNRCSQTWEGAASLPGANATPASLAPPAALSAKVKDCREELRAQHVCMSLFGLQLG